MRSRWLITPPVARWGSRWSSWSSPARRGGLSCVCITVNFNNDRAVVQEETKFLNQEYPQALSASVERYFYLL